ncbi:MAG: GIY-YIG nuclease family protein [Chitinophagaceae bacterium]|nr:MAG: GIY-YIG nuclease family protein [Chitinophagaceae bacterium]
MWTFYILYSGAKNSYYIGFTGGLLLERLRKHNTHHKGFTGSVGDWEVKYTGVYQAKEEATRRERQVKKWKSRKLVEKLIGSKHSD